MFRRPSFIAAATTLWLGLFFGQQISAATPLWEIRAQQREAKRQAKKSKGSTPVVEAPRYASEVDRVMGKEARAVIQLLGEPVQDVREASARKLQFATNDCILDTYLYAPEAGKDPVVTFVSSRVPDGRDAERNSCITALRQKR